MLAWNSGGQAGQLEGRGRSRFDATRWNALLLIAIVSPVSSNSELSECYWWGVADHAHDVIVITQAVYKYNKYKF